MSAKGTTFTTEKLEDCFSCGSDLGPFVASPDGIRQVLCSTCGARGAYERKDMTAEALWNCVSTNQK
jgi:hypothetical protein